MYRYHYPELMKVPTIDTWGWKVDTAFKYSFVGTIRKYCKSNKDQIRIESGLHGSTLNYYTSDLVRLEKIVQYIDRLRNKQKDTSDLMLDLVCIRYFPGTLTERDIHYRKTRLPHRKFKFQLVGERLERNEFKDWCVWSEQYPEEILITNRHNTRAWGTWCGDNIGYVSTEKMLALAKFKLGSKIKKVIEYQIRNEK